MTHFELQDWRQYKNIWVMHIFLYFVYVSLVLFFLFPNFSTVLFLSLSSLVARRNCRGNWVLKKQDQNGEMATAACLMRSCSLALQEASWTRGGGAGVSWRMKPSCGSAPSRRHWSQAGSTKKAEACRRFHAATGNAVGLCFENPSWCTLRMTARKSWRGQLISEGQSEWGVNPFDPYYLL